MGNTVERQIDYLWKICGGFGIYNFRDKEECAANYIMYMLNRTQRIFEYKNLPDTIPAYMLERYIQTNGSVCISEYGGKLYAFFGGLGGSAESPYYQPTWYTVANTALNFSKTLIIGKDCEIIRNDAFCLGLMPMFSRYASALVENDISMDMANKHLRAQFAITAPNDAALAAANKFLEDIADGVDGAMLNKSLADMGIEINPMIQSGTHILQELTEYGQYIKAAWFNEVGLNANFNMKRENISESESEMNFDALIPLIDEMLTERKEGLERVNKLYGTSISVELSGVWKKTEKEMTETEKEQTEMKDESGETENEADNGK